MKLRDVIYIILVGVSSAYLGIRLQKRIDKRLRQPDPHPRGGDGGRVSFWLKLLENHRNNMPYVLAILGVLASTATVQYNEALAKFLCTTTFSSLYQKVNSNNLYIKALEQRQIANKFIEASNLLEAFELTPQMTYNEKIAGYKLILVDLLSCDTKKMLIYNTIALATLLIYLFTGNLLVFTNMIWALVQLIKEGKISRAVGKTLIVLLRQKGILIPKELEEIISEE
jgi:hypothetical protein